MAFFKATDGVVTVFRGSSKALRSASFYRHEGETWLADICWSTKPGKFVAVEIGHQEYRLLATLKAARIRARGGDPARANAPYTCWIKNTALPNQE